MTGGEAPVLTSARSCLLSRLAELPPPFSRGRGLAVSSVSGGLCLCGGLGFGSQDTSGRPCLVGYTRLGFRKWVSKVPAPRSKRGGLLGSMVSSQGSWVTAR